MDVAAIRLYRACVAVSETQRIEGSGMRVVERVMVTRRRQSIAQALGRPMLQLRPEGLIHEVAVLWQRLIPAGHGAAQRAGNDRAAVDAVALDALQNQPLSDAAELVELAGLIDADLVDHGAHSGLIAGTHEAAVAAGGSPSDPMLLEQQHVALAFGN